MNHLLLVSLFALTPLAPTQAIAQGMEGSYFGSTLNGNSTESLLKVFEANQLVQPRDFIQVYTDSATTTDEPIQFQGRLDVPNFPFSVRGMAYSSPEAKAIMPVISYDRAVLDNANIYAGVGYAFVETMGENSATPVGDSDGMVLTTGVEAKVTNHLILFGDAKLRLDPNSERMQATESPVQFQFGVGYGF
jgi:hypothetical protein